MNSTRLPRDSVLRQSLLRSCLSGPSWKRAGRCRLPPVFPTPAGPLPRGHAAHSPAFPPNPQGNPERDFQRGPRPRRITCTRNPPSPEQLPPNRRLLKRRVPLQAPPHFRPRESLPRPCLRRPGTFGSPRKFTFKIRAAESRNLSRKYRKRQHGPSLLWSWPFRPSQRKPKGQTYPVPRIPEELPPRRHAAGSPVPPVNP